MSLISVSLVYFAIAMGHVAFFVYLVNVIHSFGARERWMSLAKVGLLSWLVVGGLFLAWEAIQARPLQWSLAGRFYGAVCFLVGGVAFPLFTLYHHFRVRPKAVEHRSLVIDLAKIHGVDNLVGEGRYARFLRFPWNESLKLRKVDWEIEIPGLPASLDGLTILQVSDLHFAPCFKPRYFEEVIELATQWEADLVFFTGDLVDHDSAIDWVVPILSRLRGRLGTFAILGNHDYEHHAEALLEALEAAGYTTLEGKTTTIDIRGVGINLAGTSFPWGKFPDLTALPQADFAILLSHCPDLFHWATRNGFNLMFSGHNHGGQIRLPLVGPVFMPSRYSRRFDRGFFRDRQLTLHVCQGIAGKHPIRYGGCIPELNRLTLRSPSARFNSTKLPALESLPAETRA